MARIVEKDPDSDATYTLDWTNQLGTGITISSSSWTLPTGVTETTSSNTDTSTSITVGGGTEGTTYELTNDVTPSAGSGRDASIYVYVRQQVLDEVRVLPLTLDEIKHSLRVTSNSDDEYIYELLTAAVDFVESVTGRDLISKTYTINCPKFPSDGFEIDQSPTRAVARIRYYDSDNARQTLAPTTYSVYDRDDGSTHVEQAIDQSWPSTANRSDAVELLIVSGYGVDSDNVPAMAKQAIRRFCRIVYDNPGIVAAEDQALKAMLWNLRTGAYADV